MWSADQYKGFFEWRGDRPDVEPHYGVFYLIIVPILAGVGFVAWLGWTWPAFLLTVATALLVVGIIISLAVKRHRREGSRVPEWR